jgi:hypothetical protein
LEALRDGRPGDRPADALDLTSGGSLSATQAVICYKNGLGKPNIVVDWSVPEYLIFRIRKDVLRPANVPNLMNFRRAGKAKDHATETTWSSDDIGHVRGIAIDVPENYNQRPEKLVELIPEISKDERKRMKDNGEKVPKQPDVQLYIEWKKPIRMIDKYGKANEIWTSWESRSGCRALWRKKKLADDYLLDYATAREKNFRNAQGSEEGPMSPVAVPANAIVEDIGGS